jgi:hypothetical protein
MEMGIVFGHAIKDGIFIAQLTMRKARLGPLRTEQSRARVKALARLDSPFFSERAVRQMASAGAGGDARAAAVPDRRGRNVRRNTESPD